MSEDQTALRRQERIRQLMVALVGLLDHEAEPDEMTDAVLFARLRGLLYVEQLRADSETLAGRIFDYGASVQWGSGREVFAQMDVQQIIDEWFDEVRTGKEAGAGR